MTSRHGTTAITRVALAAAAAATTTVLLVPTPARADESCHTIFTCGKVAATTSQRVLIADNWCWSDRKRYATQRLFCATERWLKPWTASSTIFDDTDAFRAPAGCITSYEISGWGGYRGTEDRRDKNAMWIKVQGWQTAYVNEVKC